MSSSSTQRSAASDDPTLASKPRPSPRARLGVLVGICGWAIGILVFAAFTGAFADLWLPGLTCLALSFVAGIGFLAAAEALARRLPSPNVDNARRCAILGATLAFVSLVCLLSTHWLGPIIERHPAFAAIYRFYRMPDIVTLALALAGAAFLTPAARELLRPTQSPP